jgi:predicted hotdog family 3-hydroxylacyl-ACP dehydratase
MSDLLDLPAEQLTAHQPPALLVERVVSAQGTDGRVRLKPHDGLEPLQLIESCAQALAVLMGLRMRAEGTGAAASGMLVGAKNFIVTRRARPGEPVEIEAKQSHELGPFQLYAVRALAMPAGEELAAGELKTVQVKGGAIGDLLSEAGL